VNTPTLETGIERQLSLEHKLLTGGVIILNVSYTCKTIINFRTNHSACNNFGWGHQNCMRAGTGNNYITSLGLMASSANFFNLGGTRVSPRP